MMLQSEKEIPRVESVPAPWRLRGNAWIVAMRWPRAANKAERSRFIAAELQPTLAGPLSLLMFVDYTAAPCGPYRELLFVPGSLRFATGDRHLSISRILVSTWESVANGRANWGIPKDRANFLIERGKDASRRVTVADAGKPFCTLAFAPPRGPNLPLDTRWLPQRWLTLAQRYQGRTYHYTPVARGRARWCQLTDWQFDASLFPDLGSARVVAALRVSTFEMTFPVARIAA